MARKAKSPIVERRIALCYVRLSVTRDSSDLTSPQRQRANLQRACEQYDWQPEWYEDTEGHKSGTKEENRPAWLALKARLRDPDVAALVVNEQSRAMRNAWRAIKLFEELPQYGVKLHLAAANRTLDITTSDGRLNAYLQAFMDDLYALDAARRAVDSVQYRKGKGVTIGLPPFGTVRNGEGHLIPSPAGVWLLPDGSYSAAENDQTPPAAEALWRGYHGCAQRMLELYKDNLHGYLGIAQRVRQEGWVFRDRHDQPRLIELDDVRRVVANWREYAGLVTQGRAKERVAHEVDNPAGVLRDTGRAVFELELLRAVAQTQAKRSVTTRSTGTVSQAHIFSLSDLLYCAHCQAAAVNADNPRLRARLIGWNQKGKLRYRHSESRTCSCGVNSVLAQVVEADFAALVRVLDARPEALEAMVQLAVNLQAATIGGEAENELEEKKKAHLAKHTRALKNNLLLFQDGEIEAEEYQRQRDFHERQIVFWQSQTTDQQRIRLELTTALEMVQRIKQFWEVTTGEDRKLLAHSLFDEIVFDLATKRIVDFRLKPWAEPFLMMRAAIYEDEEGEKIKSRFNSGISFCDPNGLWRHTFTHPRNGYPYCA